MRKFILKKRHFVYKSRYLESVNKTDLLLMDFTSQWRKTEINQYTQQVNKLYIVLENDENRAREGRQSRAVQVAI